MKDKIFSVGDVVVSRCGHDKGRYYVITGIVSPEFVLLCDGKYRPMDKPKRKRAKHLVPEADSGLATMLLAGNATDADIKCALKKSMKGNQTGR